MNIWEKHAEREKGRAKFEKIEQWCRAHPWQARLWTLGFAIAIIELAGFLRFGIEAIAKHFQ